jgi:hypothetical protein
MENVKFSLVNPGDMKATVAITMTVNQWRQLMRQLDTGYPSWKLGSAIADVIRQAESSFYSEHEAKA